MTSKKAGPNNGVLILLITAIVLGVFFIAYQQKIIRSLKRTLSLISGESSKQPGDSAGGGKEASAVVNYNKDELMAELMQIKAKLSETESLLKQAQQEKESLKEENGILNKTVAGLKEELRLWEGRISSLDEKSLVMERRNRSIKELKKRIWDFKVKAQREIDNVKMQLGNHGYLARGGKSTFSREKIVQLEKIIITHPR